MIKKFVDFFKNGVTKSNKNLKSSEELVEQLMDSITYNNYKSFIDAINSGVDLNVMVSSGHGNVLYTPFISCLMHRNLKFAKILIDKGVDLFKQPGYVNSMDDYMKMMLNGREYNEMMYYILKKYPNFKEELEIRKSGSKYNL